MQRQRRSPLLLVTSLFLLLTPLGAMGCADEEEEAEALVSVGEDGISSALVVLFSAPIEEAEASTTADEEVLIWERHLSIANIQPGDYEVTLSINGARGVLHLPDLRPKTTALVYVRPQGEHLEMIAHRRLSATFEADDRPEGWRAELTDVP